MGLVLKQAGVRRVSRLALIRVNYAVAALLGFGCAVVFGQTQLTWPTAILGCVTGILFVAGLALWTKAIETAGLALSVVAMRTAIVIPVLAAALIWQEKPNWLEMIGAAIALSALGLVLWDVATSPEGAKSESYATVTQDVCSGYKATTLPAWFWLMSLFLVDGLVMSAAQVFRHHMPQEENFPFQVVIFVSAFVVTSVFYFLRRRQLGRSELSYGALLGVANLGNYLFLVLALALLPGVVVYPVLAGAEVGLLTLAGTIVWRERIGVRSWLGIGFAVVALVLVQIARDA